MAAACRAWCGLGIYLYLLAYISKADLVLDFNLVQRSAKVNCHTNELIDGCTHGTPLCGVGKLLRE
jgi:hypothetical protein